MSAFICSPLHIAVLAQRLLQRFGGEPSVHTDKILTVSEFVENLVNLNLKSVAYRYRSTPAKIAKSDTGRSRKAYIEECQQMAESQAVWKMEFEERDLWGIAACYLYQSCEHPGAEEDVTYRTVEQYQNVLKAACQRRGEEKGIWGL